MIHKVPVGSITLGQGEPLAIIAGPCVIEEEELTLQIARALKEIAGRVGVPLIFKASYDKANRTSADSYRGPGMERGLEVLGRIKSETGLPLLSDVHCRQEVASAAEVLDVLQVPAFLSRQTDLLLAVGRTGKPVNVKKGQFLAPWDAGNIFAKIESTGNRNIMITERGVSFGYNNLVSDMRSLPILRQYGYPVIFDATHSVQLPGGAGTASGGQREFVPFLARAAVACGCDAVFMEVHPSPESAKCDGPNTLALHRFEPLVRQLKAIASIVGGKSGTLE